MVNLLCYAGFLLPFLDVSILTSSYSFIAWSPFVIFNSWAEPGSGDPSKSTSLFDIVLWSCLTIYIVFLESSDYYKFE